VFFVIHVCICVSALNSSTVLAHCCKLYVKLYVFSRILLVICRHVQVNIVLYFMNYAAVAYMMAS